MTIEARLNLQRGVPEGKIHKGRNYTNESPLDSYIIQKQKMRNKLVEYAELEDYLNSMISESLEEVLEDLLKDFW